MAQNERNLKGAWKGWNLSWESLLKNSQGEWWLMAQLLLILALLLLSLLLQQLAYGLFLALGDFRLNELLGAALAGCAALRVFDVSTNSLAPGAGANRGRVNAIFNVVGCQRFAPGRMSCGVR